MVWACDEKRGALRRKWGGGAIEMKVQDRRKRGRPIHEQMVGQSKG